MLPRMPEIKEDYYYHQKPPAVYKNSSTKPVAGSRNTKISTLADTNIVQNDLPKCTRYFTIIVCLYSTKKY